jgi:hypothetical protein
MSHQYIVSTQGPAWSQLSTLEDPKDITIEELKSIIAQITSEILNCKKNIQIANKNSILLKVLGTIINIHYRTQKILKSQKYTTSQILHNKKLSQRI